MCLCVVLCLLYLVPWATNDGGEDSPGGVITGETGLAHAGAIVNDQSGCVFVTHLESCCLQTREFNRELSVLT